MSSKLVNAQNLCRIMYGLYYSTIIYDIICYRGANKTNIKLLWNIHNKILIETKCTNVQMYKSSDLTIKYILEEKCILESIISHYKELFLKYTNSI